MGAVVEGTANAVTQYDRTHIPLETDPILFFFMLPSPPSIKGATMSSL